MTDQKKITVCLKDKLLKFHANKDINSKSVKKPKMKGHHTVDRWTDKDK